MLKQIRRTKIIATLGPSTDNYNNIENMIISGMDIVRLNFSHGKSEDHLRRAKKIREVSKKLNKYVSIIGDLQGPKIRISSFKFGKILLKTGDKFILDSSLHYKCGDSNQVGVEYEYLSDDVINGDILLLDDGKIRLKVVNISGKKVYTEVIIGGFLSDNKSINKLGGGLSAESLTEKDKSDIVIASNIGVDYLAVSFPKTSEDLNYARHLARKSGSLAKIISKIERAEVVNNDKTMDNIIIASDAVMIARGDLGVEIGNSRLMEIQKKIIRRSKYFNRPVIIATQMMESMVVNPMPTRAEVIDVANSVLEGADAVMLSAETATGKYPVETILSMSDICLGTEKFLSISYFENQLDKEYKNSEEAICIATMNISNHLKNVSAILMIANSDHFVFSMSKINFSLPIFVLSKNEDFLKSIILYRGVIPIYFNTKNDNKLNLTFAIEFLCSKSLLSKGDLIILSYENEKSSKETNSIHIINI